MTWYPVATEYDVLSRTLFRSQLFDRELVLWRADDGFVNIWENRCLHRGVRLSIGVNTGAELVCRYHGWRYANRSAGCTYIPAHPANSPARTISNTTFPVVEHNGLVWTTNDPTEDFTEHPLLEGDTLTLRSYPVAAPAGVVLDRLLGHRFTPTYLVATGAGEPARIVSRSERSRTSVAIWTAAGGHEARAVFFVQPVGNDRSVIRPVLAGRPDNPLPVLRHHAATLGAFVRRIAAEQPDPSGRTASLLEVPVALSSPATSLARSARLEVEVISKATIAKDIVSFSLASTGPHALPTTTPGAHIDLHLPGGLVRQYSLTNAPGEDKSYRIAVKLSADSKGGSSFLHDSLNVGDILQASEPRNGFPLRRNVPHTTFLAGGIGVTPLIAMASALESSKLEFSFHQFSADAAAVAFRHRLAAFGDRFEEHLGLSAERTRDTLTTLLADPSPERQLYCCGPPPMLDAIREIAERAGWPTESVHFEYFENPNELDLDSSFTLDLARSGQTFEVPSGKTILDVLRSNDVPVASSCETGACGTCQATVLGGEPLHQDVYLNGDERSAGQVMMPCVSRAVGDRLVLDL